jgi:AraC family transcriptional regulator
LPHLDVITSPVPPGVFPSPVDRRHVLCLHLGDPVPVTYRASRAERSGVRLHGQFCVVPAGSSTRWTMSQPATSLLLRLQPAVWDATVELAPAIHIRDPQIERIAWAMQAEERDGAPSGRVFADSLASALAARLLALQTGRVSTARGGLPAWRLRRVVDYIEANLDGDVSLADLAEVAGYSVSHFKALFRRSLGRPVHRFVLERRVERARALRADGTRSLVDVALETGFAHPSHMARCMRRILGITPALARNS